MADSVKADSVYAMYGATLRMIQSHCGSVLRLHLCQCLVAV